jgi:hypothetical protein
MYFVFYFITGIVILAFFLYKFLQIMFDKRGYNSTANRVYAFLLFMVMTATFINIIIAVYSYRNTISMAGHSGERGVRGNRGRKGVKGSCNEKCGQKVCYVEIFDHANEVFKREVEKILENSKINIKTKLKKNEFKIKNGFFLDKINSICKSEQYQTIMLGKHPKKPSEKRLIDYLKGIIEEWIVFLVSDRINTGCFTGEKYEKDLKLNNYKCVRNKDIDLGDNLLEQRHKGIKFLLDSKYTPDILNYKDDTNLTFNPFDEFKKYDIWNWGNGLKINPLEIKVETKNLEKPMPDQARLQIRKSNNYKWVFDTTTPKDKWDDTNCDYNQMGKDKTNPQNLSKCVYINKNNYLKDYTNTWKTQVYNKGNEISLYNADTYKDNETNQKFYPIGSVWRGSKEKAKPKGSNRSPASKNSCGVGHGLDGTNIAKDEGPEKETILVSGDVKHPEKFDLLWNNKSGCQECQTHNVNIYRPVAPEGYTCLGDVASTSEPDTQKYVCVPNDCVREKRLGNKFYDNKNVTYDKYDNYKSYIARTPYQSDRQLTMSLWASGMDNIGVSEEQRNNYGYEYNDDQGYNLLRAGRGLRKPNLKTYVIKEECLLPGGGSQPKHPEFDASEYLRKSDTTNRYNTKEYFGSKPPFAILTNNDKNISENNSLLNFEKKPLRIYLEDDFNTRKNGKPDTYFIKTYNPEKNDFSLYITSNINGDIKYRQGASKNNEFHRWVIEVNKNELLRKPEDFTYSVDIIPYGLRKKNDRDARVLKQHYDSMSKSQFNLVEKDLSESQCWLYNTMVKESPPLGFDQ